MQLLAPHKENYGQKARILDAAIRYALQRIERFAFLNPIGKQSFGSFRPRPQLPPFCSTVFGGGLQFFSSLAVASRFGRETMLTKPISVQFGCSHLIQGHRLDR